MSERRGYDQAMTTATDHQDQNLYRALARAIWLAAGIFLAFWFINAITFVLLFFTTVFILTIALNPPVRWMEKRGVPRVVGTLLLGAALLAVVGVAAWIIAPRVIREATDLAQNLPTYAATGADRLTHRLEDFPQIQHNLRLDAQTIGRFLPTVQTFLLRVGQYSLSMVGFFVLMVVMASTMLYALVRPEPLLKGYIGIFPERLQEPAERAFIRGSKAVVGWLWSNIIVGALEALASSVALTLLGFPARWCGAFWPSFRSWCRASATT